MANKKRVHLYRHGVRLNHPPQHIPQKQYNIADPRPGSDKRTLKKQSQAKDEAEVSFYMDIDEELQRIAEKKAKRAEDEATVKKQMAKDEAEEKARQKKLAEERKKKKKKKLAPKKKSPPKRKLSINRRKSRIKK